MTSSASTPSRLLERAEAAQVIREAARGAAAEAAGSDHPRDMVGCTPEETCNPLGLTDADQRVLLHRARTKVRAALEAAFDTTEALA